MNQLFIDRILLIGAFQAFFLAALLIKKKGKVPHDFEHSPSQEETIHNH